MVKNIKIKNTPDKTNNRLSISTKDQSIVFIVLHILIHAILLEPMFFDANVPQGVDVIGSIGQNSQYIKHQNQSGETALWNPYVFAGNPIYFKLNAQIPSFDSLINWLGKYFGMIFIWYQVGGIILFFFLRYLGMSPIAAFFGTISFTFFPHYHAIWVEGHYAKLRAVMFIPAVTFSAKYFFDSRKIFAAICFALTFGNQIRTHHYQIVFYTALLVFAIGLIPLLKYIIERKIKTFAFSSSVLSISIIASILLAAQPLFLAKEYLPYAARGAHTIDLSKNNVKEKELSGLDIQSATQWSTHPSSILGWLVARYQGGMSNEKYNGNKYPQLVGRSIPSYWGSMPFTQSYEYFGPVVIIMTIFGSFYYRKKTLIKSLVLICLFFILLSFGRHFQSFYEMFFIYLPYFKNFRAPMMSINITAFIFAILCAFGLKAFQEKMKTEDKTIIFWIFCFFIFLGITLWFRSDLLIFSKTGERLQAQAEIIVKNIRKEFYITDLKRYFLLLMATFGAIIFPIFYKGNQFIKKPAKVFFSVFLCTFVLVDYISINERKDIKYVNREKLKKNYFKLTATDKWLLDQPGIFRIFPVGRLFSDNRWSYYHQNIGGYSPVKMNRIEEIIKNCLYVGIDGKPGLNENVLKILNVKYIISEAEINHSSLLLSFQDPNTGWFTYLYENYLPRAYFTDSTDVVLDPRKRLESINQIKFNPPTNALIEEDLNFIFQKPNNPFIKMSYFSPNSIEWDVNTDKNSLLVISENPYEPGWKATVNDNNVNIFAANHVNIALPIPKGKNTIKLTFHPDSFFFYKSLELFAALSIYFALCAIFYIHFRYRKLI